MGMNTIASRDQFKPIRIGQNLVVNYNGSYFSHTTNISRLGWVCGQCTGCTGASTLSQHAKIYRPECSAQVALSLTAKLKESFYFLKPISRKPRFTWT